MDKIVIASKFTKSGKRVLKRPVSDRSVCAPINRKYKGAFENIDDEWKEKRSAAKAIYVESMARHVATYFSGECSSKRPNYRFLYDLAKEALESSGVRWLMDHLVTAVRSSESSDELSALRDIERRLRNEYSLSMNQAERSAKAAKQDIQDRCIQMRRELWREVEEHIVPAIAESRRKTELKLQSIKDGIPEDL